VRPRSPLDRPDTPEQLSGQGATHLASANVLVGLRDEPLLARRSPLAYSRDGPYHSSPHPCGHPEAWPHQATAERPTTEPDPCPATRHQTATQGTAVRTLRSRLLPMLMAGYMDTAQRPGARHRAPTPPNVRRRPGGFHTRKSWQDCEPRTAIQLLIARES
jgi:hypothetical protein